MTAPKTAYDTAPKEFFLGGRCVFTIIDGAGNHYTYRISRTDANPEKNWKEAWWVALLIGPDNTKNYKIFANLNTENGYLTLTRRTELRMDNLSVKAVSFVLETIWKGETLPDWVKIQPPSRCSRCGRLLTAPPEQNPYFPWYGPECGKK